jgi:hypothetical protein
MASWSLYKEMMRSLQVVLVLLLLLLLQLQDGKHVHHDDSGLSAHMCVVSVMHTLVHFD